MPQTATPTLTPDQMEALADPRKFIRLCWPDMWLYDKQAEILTSVRDHVETFVHAANATGKTRTAALAALWFFETRRPARVILSSSTMTQLNTVLWAEIRNLMMTSQYPFRYRSTFLSLRKLTDTSSLDDAHAEVLPLDYMIGSVTSSAEAFQGHHLPNDKPRVLWVSDESSATEDKFDEAADTWAHRKLVIGNPLGTTNFFYRKCKFGDVPDPAGREKLLRKVIHISGEDSPNVLAGNIWSQRHPNARSANPPNIIPGLLSYAEFQRRLHDWDEIQRTTRLYGHFYEGQEALLFPGDWLRHASQVHQDASQRYREKHGDNAQRRPIAIGLDVAMGGADKTVWTFADKDGILNQVAINTADTMDIAGRTMVYLQEHSLHGPSVAIDAGGGGKQIADRLAELGQSVHVIWFGSSADDKTTHLNKRAELYGTMRRLLNPANGGYGIPDDCGELRKDIGLLPLRYDSEGRLKLLPKDRTNPGSREPTIRDLIGRSPDYGDSAALACWVVADQLHEYGMLDLDRVRNPSPNAQAFREALSRAARPKTPSWWGKR